MTIVHYKVVEKVHFLANLKIIDEDLLNSILYNDFNLFVKKLEDYKNSRRIMTIIFMCCFYKQKYNLVDYILDDLNYNNFEYNILLLNDENEVIGNVLNVVYVLENYKWGKYFDCIINSFKNNLYLSLTINNSYGSNLLNYLIYDYSEKLYNFLKKTNNLSILKKSGSDENYLIPYLNSNLSINHKIETLNLLFILDNDISFINELDIYSLLQLDHDLFVLIYNNNNFNKDKFDHYNLTEEQFENNTIDYDYGNNFLNNSLYILKNNPEYFLPRYNEETDKYYTNLSFVYYFDPSINSFGEVYAKHLLEYYIRQDIPLHKLYDAEDEPIYFYIVVNYNLLQFLLELDYDIKFDITALYSLPNYSSLRELITKILMNKTFTNNDIKDLFISIDNDDELDSYVDWFNKKMDL